MAVGIISLVVLLIGAAGYVLGRSRALASADGDVRNLHSLPGYYGQTVLIFAVVPAFLVMFAWLLAQPAYVESRVSGMIAASDVPEGGSVSLVMADIRRIASGLSLLVDAGLVSNAELDRMRADFADVRGRLGEVGVVVG
ncbi:MAG: phosphate ABC transporter permease family protein, partial [Pseudomonadota bacterium]